MPLDDDQVISPVGEEPPDTVAVQVVEVSGVVGLQLTPMLVATKLEVELLVVEVVVELELDVVVVVVVVELVLDVLVLVEDVVVELVLDVVVVEVVDPVYSSTLKSS